MAEHEAPPAATLQVITGRAQLHSATQEWQLNSGDLMSIPHERHGLRALDDTVLLLTVRLEQPPDAPKSGQR